MSYDLAVIGSGPGGYQAAVRAAQLGMKVAVVEKAELGGICGNWGCIPTKALLAAAELLERMRGCGEMGLTANEVGFDFAKVIARSRKVADQQARGVAYLFKKNKIEHIKGTAVLRKPRALFVDGKEVSTKYILMATGARPKALPGIEHDGDRVLSYREAMILPSLPKTLAIIGAGAIGVEFAYFYSVLGTKVTLLEALPRILPIEDEEIAQALAKSFQKRGIEVVTSATVEKLEKSDKAVKISLGGTAKRTIEAERALLAVGVRGNIEGMGLEDVGIKVERNFIVVDKRSYQTSVKGVFAIGDVAGPPWLAHKASAEGIVCVERIAGKTVANVPYDAIPGCTYCKPEVASVGLTEQAARAAGHDVKVGRFPLSASGKARAVDDTEGFVKVVLGKHGELLGAHLLGGTATDLVAELTLMKSAELTVDEIVATVHAHPTFAENIKEAVEAAYGHAIDI